MCQRDNNPTIEQTTAEGHLKVFNVARNYRTQSRPSAGPLTNIYEFSDNERHTKL